MQPGQKIYWPFGSVLSLLFICIYQFTMKRLLAIVFILIAGIVVAWVYFSERNSILSVTLTSPGNTAMHNLVTISLKKPAPLYIEYTEKVSGKKFRTVTSPAAVLHHIHLLLLKANTEYTYRIIIANLYRQKSELLSFKTRPQSPWLENHWFNEKHPHDTSALGDGMILVSFGRLPGYMALIDNEGEIRWYWQIEDVGIRVSSLTPRGTILGMLRPFAKDEIDDQPQTPEEIANEEHKKPMRRGSMGFAGGTGLVEVSLTGEMMWRLDLNKVETEKDYQVIHHDIWMDEENHIHTLYRPKKVASIMVDGKMQTDTLGGDGIMVVDSLGKVLKTWSAWDVWDISKDPYIGEYRYDRFHMNGLCFDKDGNYLVSNPIEDQIWKIDRKTGKILWKFGRGGDFKMDSTSYFSFQHSPYMMPDGNLILFDNGLYNKRSGAKMFHLDEKNRTAKTLLKATLPAEKYTSRMGSAYLLPNGNILQTSSKTGSIMVTDRNGKVLWESVMSYAPYRAIYVPKETWNGYFKEIK